MTVSAPWPPPAAGPAAPQKRWWHHALTYPFRLGRAEPEWTAHPFTGLALVNNLSGAGDALVTVALAGSVFVSVSLSAARGRTALGLLCTVLPFAVVGPFLGPLVDRVRGGRKFIVFGAAIGRLAACLMMAAWIHSLLLFPAAFLSLVCSKTHAVAKAALVPGVVDDHDQLVRANSRLAVGGAVFTSLAAALGSGVYKLFGSKALLDLDVLVFAACAGLSLYLLRNVHDAGATPVGDLQAGAGVEGPSATTCDVPALADAGRSGFDSLDGGPLDGDPLGDGRRERGPLGGGPRPVPSRWRRLGRRLTGAASGPIPRSLYLASVAMAGMRGVAGFLTALLVFAFRDQGASLAWYALAGVASVGGNFVGALLAPRLRLRIPERRLVGGGAFVIAVTASVVSFLPGDHRRPAAVVLAAAVAVGASVAKTAFDAIVQRETADRMRSSLFGRFESLFQLAWVVGALVPTLIPLPLIVGFVLSAATVVATSAVFVRGLEGTPVSRKGPPGSHWVSQRRSVADPESGPVARSDVPG